MNPNRQIDYLIIGHTSRDIYPEATQLGGTVAYAGLTAHRMGRKVGVITSTSQEEDLSALLELELRCSYSKKGTSFHNQYQSGQRIQRLLSQADDLNYALIPTTWREAPIVHLAPIVAEVDLTLFHRFPQSFLVATPQGWLRARDQEGYITSSRWEVLLGHIETAEAVVLSDEDLGWDVHSERALAKRCKVLAVTCGMEGVRVYTANESHAIPAPQIEEIDPTGSGDIFAAIFFILLKRTGDPMKSARLANELSAQSVTRVGLEGVPSSDELSDTLRKV